MILYIDMRKAEFCHSDTDTALVAVECHTSAIG
jgi:hypothetical protein